MAKIDKPSEKVERTNIRRLARVKYPTFALETKPFNAFVEDLKSLPTAEPATVSARTASGAEVSTHKYQAIVSTLGAKKEVVSMPTKRYNIVQHKEVFDKLLKVANLYSPDIKGRIVNDMKRAYLLVSMPEKFNFTAPDGEKLDFGFSATNSYDGTTGVHIQAFGYRLICQNGLMLRQTLGGISLDHIQGVKFRLEAMFEKLEMNLAVLSERIESAMDEKIQLAYAEAYAQHFAGKNIGSKVAELFKKEPKQTVWGLYNSLTNWFSHSDSNPEGRINKLGLAENLLIRPKEIVLEAVTLHKARVELEEAAERRKQGQ